MPAKKRVLIVHPYMGPPGGGEGLAAYVLQALHAEYEVAIACMQPPDYEGLNSYFGTSLRAADFVHYQVPQWFHWLLQCQPTPQAALRISVLERFVKRLAQRCHFDVYISTYNELSLPVRGMQYVHFPRFYPIRPEVDYRWYHRIPGALALYRRGCVWIGGATKAQVRGNLTLVNSEYVASIHHQLYNLAPRVVFPPVPGAFTVKPWSAKHDRIVCLGRISPEKALPKVIEIVRRVRLQGLQLSLLIIGTWNCPASYARVLRRLFETHQDWITLRHDVSRDELVQLLGESRYGIHGMRGEHFGMAVAEMQRAGCVVFVPDHGGPREIIGHEPRLMYACVEEAVVRIGAALRDQAMQADLYQQALQRRELFTAERFMGEIREVVGQFLGAASSGAGSSLVDTPCRLRDV